MKKKKWRDIRSAVTMMCVMLAMLSSATFAWFSLTENATVTGLEMTAVASDGLWISKDGTSWFGAIDMSEKNTVDNVEALEAFVLQPVTLKNTDLTNDKLTFGVPVYDTTGLNKVTGVTDLVDGDIGFDGYVASCEYYLKSTGNTAVNVGIITVDPADVVADNIKVENGVAKQAGSFVVETEAPANDGADHSAVEAVRVAFVVDEDGSDQTASKVVIWEPNYKTKTAMSGSTYAENGLTELATVTVVSDLDDGYIVETINADGTYDVTNQLTTSEGLFTVNQTGTKVTMYVWFEGQDAQCVDQIVEDVIKAQVQFGVVSKVTTP